MTLPDFLTQACDGEITLTGHRLGLYHLIERYNEGDPAEMIASRYPTVPLSTVHRTIAFYLDQKAEVDAYLAACSAALNEQRAAGSPLDVSALRQRLSQAPVGKAAG